MQAKTFRVVSLQHFSSKFPLDVFNVKIIERVELGNNLILEPGTIIAGKIIRVQRQKLFKRNAYFEFIPSLMSYNDETNEINNPNYAIRIADYRHLDPEGSAVYIGKLLLGCVTVGGSVLVSVVQGLMESESEHRGETVLKRVFNDSIFCFIGSGSELNIEPGDELKLEIKTVH